MYAARPAKGCEEPGSSMGGLPVAETWSCEPSTGADMHDLKLRYKLAAPTVKSLCAMPDSLDRREVLQRACLATECQSFPMQQPERAFFRDINDHNPVPYPVQGSVSEPWQKVFLLVQADLSRLGWPNKISTDVRRRLHQERGRIYLLLDRILRCLVDILGRKRNGRGVSVALDVLRSLKAGVWEGGDKELLQVEGIGPVKMNRLVQAGVKNIRQLVKLEFFHIERLLSRNPPFGHQMLHQLSGFPLLTLDFEFLGQWPRPTTSRASSMSDAAEQAALHHPLVIARLVLGYENVEAPLWNKKHPWTTLVIEGQGGKLLWFWRGSVKRLKGGKELIIGLNVAKGEELRIAFSSEEVVGTMLRITRVVSW